MLMASLGRFPLNAIGTLIVISMQCE
jgi:hypothetical protein